MASKYLKAATAKVAGQSTTAGVGDGTLFKNRPALEEFMTLLVDDEGKPREPSALMIALRDNGVAAGLKDDAAGGWCWRVGDTLQKALDGIEKALTGPEPAFKAAGGWKGKKGR